ncbi:hypothetical protein P3X46_008577 [Hevea brasiliensis]|uniref:GATA-type domain-containing protein n=1 Tax=Hevea brasiliensis TaxID=3981 RepID=A0ABQ9ML20_HEVBR|nr:GATA transcription factor 15 isoform X1 [Hevea brasiliensis]KAJ9180315.1 hypothetical protein P3X46_008577 [Hevea brasiliensis]
MVIGVMDDLGEKKSLHDDEQDKSMIKNACTVCKTTKTPLWRSGPAGPKSLCNACGIRYRKRRRSILRLDEDSEKKKRSHCTTLTSTAVNSSTSATSVNGVNGNELGESLKIRLIVEGGKRKFEISSVVKKQTCQRRRELEEEEQAAFSLMALSCDSFFACNRKR